MSSAAEAKSFAPKTPKMLAKLSSMAKNRMFPPGFRGVLKLGRLGAVEEVGRGSSTGVRGEQMNGTSEV